MTLTVETGTGAATSNSFVALTDCDNYHSGLGNSLWTGADADKEAAIRRATAYVSTAFRYSGAPLTGRTQALSWPRKDVLDGNGLEVASDSVPIEVSDATCEAALYELTNPNGLNLTITMTDRVKREKVDVIETEYASAPTSAEAARPILSKLDNLLSAFILGDAGADSSNVVYLDRA